MFITCWKAVSETNNPLRKEISTCINSTVGGLQFICIATSYNVKFEDKKLRLVDVANMTSNCSLHSSKVSSFTAHNLWAYGRFVSPFNLLLDQRQQMCQNPWYQKTLCNMIALIKKTKVMMTMTWTSCHVFVFTMYMYLFSVKNW